MRIHNIRRITADRNHNAFTGAGWFQGALYVAFRQGDSHGCRNGKLVVMRSRDGGERFDTVTVLRGQYDTRDAHLYSDGKRLWATGFECDAPTGALMSGAAWTENGINWSPWTRYTGADGFVMWRPRHFKGRYYCAGYGDGVHWFESRDGIHWKNVRVLSKGPDAPNECALDFKPDGAAAILMRREHASWKPLLLQARPPYKKWSAVELDISLTGPALWFVDDSIWISGRWYLGPGVRHEAVYKIVDGKPVLRLVLPSGGGDFGYAGVARHPDDPRRIALSYYSSHLGAWDPGADPRPDVYLADISFEPSFIDQWKFSAVQAGQLRDARCPDPRDKRMGWLDLNCAKDTDAGGHVGFADAHECIAGRAGLVYFVSEVDGGPCRRGNLFLGYDGPIIAWVNGRKAFEGPGDNPALPDKTKVAVTFKRGKNRIAVCLDTNGGKAWGIFARYEAADRVIHH